MNYSSFYVQYVATEKKVTIAQLALHYLCVYAQVPLFLHCMQHRIEGSWTEIIAMTLEFGDHGCSIDWLQHGMM
jgi:hypothetical protein